MKTSAGQLVNIATDLFRRQGYSATSIDDICERAGITKGGFFHHFDSKEHVAHACLKQWDASAAQRESLAVSSLTNDPVKRAIGYMDFYIAVFQSPRILKSCLAGTTVQEVSETNPKLRDAANNCFVQMQARFKELLDAAFAAGGIRGKKKPDTASLAALWIAAMQGSLILAKASRDEAVIGESMKHVREYIRSRLVPNKQEKR